MHKGLSVFFIHGVSRPGTVPLTLQEALAKGFVRIDETGNVNELTIENLGHEDVFIQSGDVVKGGRQDRVLGVSLLLAPRSGKVPIASFCVESGRWGRRAFEDASRFSASRFAYSPRRAKLAMMELSAGYDEATRSYVSPTRSLAQAAVWDSVAETQSALARRVVGDVRAAPSPTSLQLSMESPGVEAANAEYMARLEPAGRNAADVTGAIFAINGKVVGAESYPWSGLFAKMWEKNLAARVTEALAAERDLAPRPPAAGSAEAFLADGDAGQESRHPLPAGAELRRRHGKLALREEACAAPGHWVHRSYLEA